MLRDLLRRVGTVLLAGLGLGGAPQAAAVTEYELKAAFLYNFASFTEWPPGSAPGMAVCVLGRDPFGPALDALQGKTVQGAPLEVRRIATAAEAHACRIVFIGAEAGDDYLDALAELCASAVLTVADGKGAVQQGVMIGLVSDGGRVGFEINTAVARNAGLTLSSKLLRLARRLHPSP